MLTAVVILLTGEINKKGGIVKKKVEGAIGGAKVEDYLQTSKLYLLNDTNSLLTLLKTFDVKIINPDYIKKMEKVVL